MSRDPKRFVNLYLEEITKSDGLLPIKDLLLRKTNDSKSKSVFYFNRTNNRVRVYLMKKMYLDFKKLSYNKMKEPQMRRKNTN